MPRHIQAMHRTRWAGLALAAACIAAFFGSWDAWAHDPHHKMAPKDRVELSFGRDPQHDYDTPEPGSYRLPPIKAAGDGVLLDHNGNPQRLRSLYEGRITVLAFIYLNCTDPQGCPLSMGLMHDLHWAAGKDPVIGMALQLITVSFDPGRDTPEALKQYAEGMIDPKDPGRWRLLTAASKANLQPILDAYGQRVQAKKNPDDPYGSIAHMLRVVLIDKKGLIRNIYSLGFMDPRLVLSDIRTLLLEEVRTAPKG